MVNLSNVEDGDLIYEMIERGYTVTREKYKKKDRDRDNRDTVTSSIKESEIKQFPVPNSRSDLGPGMVNNPLGNNPFASDEKIQAQARVGFGVLTELVQNVVSPPPKSNVEVKSRVEVPKVKKVTLVDIDEVLDGKAKKRK